MLLCVHARVELALFQWLLLVVILFVTVVLVLSWSTSYIRHFQSCTYMYALHAQVTIPSTPHLRLYFTSSVHLLIVNWILTQWSRDLPSLSVTFSGRMFVLLPLTGMHTNYHQSEESLGMRLLVITNDDDYYYSIANNIFPGFRSTVHIEAKDYEYHYRFDTNSI